MCVVVGNRRWPPEDKESGTPASSDSEQRGSHLFLILASTTATRFYSGYTQLRPVVVTSEGGDEWFELPRVKRAKRYLFLERREAGRGGGMGEGC